MTSRDDKREESTKGIAPFPDRVVVELTPKCNLECPMCPRHYIAENDGFMTMELWKKVVDEIMAVSPRSIILPFWRGESLLHPDFCAFMEYALSKSARIHISTNGQMMTPEIARVLLNAEFVTFSVHSPQGFKTARAFSAMRKAASPAVQISFVEGEASSGFLDEIVAEPDLFGFDGVRLYEEHTKDGVFGQTGAEIKEPRIFCGKLQGTLVVAYNGTVSRCNHIWETDRELSAVQSSLKEIWGSQRFVEIRSNYPDASCTPCDQWTGHTRGQSWRMVDGKVEHQIFG